MRSLLRLFCAALVFFGLIALMFITLQKYGGQDIAQGNVVVIDGDSLREGATEIRLYGIDAPEYRQTCRDEFRHEYACGKRAAEELRKLVGQGEVKCRRLMTDRYVRAVSICMVDGQDIARAMVERGWAVAFTEFGVDYVPTELLAHKAKRGLWAGDFENPSDYRKRLRNVQSNVGGEGGAEPD